MLWKTCLEVQACAQRLWIMILQGITCALSHSYPQHFRPIVNRVCKDARKNVNEELAKFCSEGTSGNELESFSYLRQIGFILWIDAHLILNGLVCVDDGAMIAASEVQADCFQR